MGQDQVFRRLILTRKPEYSGCQPQKREVLTPLKYKSSTLSTGIPNRIANGFFRFFLLFVESRAWILTPRLRLLSVPYAIANLGENWNDTARSISEAYASPR